ncbi:hypothetical protein [Thermodesulfovibrio sp.]|uniref:hypothetical protein n=1 Tax=Thermodesulfovibrio sp. TaxID=2067987 RepID=UPI0030AB31A9
MSKKECYGWDMYKEEGLSELKKIKQSKIFSGKDKFQGLLDRYIEIYNIESNFTKKIPGTRLFHEEFKNKSSKHALDKAYRVIKEFKVLLKEYYEKGEGQTSQFEIYFIAETRDYRSGKFKWDTILLFLFTSVLTLIILSQYLDAMRLKTIIRADIPDFIKSFGLLNIEIASKKISSLISFNLIFNILRYAFIFILIPWIISNTIFKEKINLSVFSNFQFYFLLSWIPLFIWFGCVYIVKILYNENTTGLLVIFPFLLVVFFFNYFRGICKLLNFNWKRGILFFITALILPILILSSL